MKKYICILSALFLIATGMNVAYAKENISFYIAENGFDSAAGGIDDPFKTIERAQQAVRDLTNVSGDVNVFIREGIYRIDKPLVFTPEDSGKNGYNINYIAYNGENVEISGGKRITGFKKYNDKLWSASAELDGEARSAYVNGRRAVRAVSDVYYNVDELFMNREGIYAGILMNDTKFVNYRNASDIQLHFGLSWLNSLNNVTSIEEHEGKSLLNMQNPQFNERCHYGLPVLKGIPFYLENAFEELDTPGEYYYDKSEKVFYYYPRENENIETADVEVPQTEGLLMIEGETAISRVSNVTFNGITFEYSAWDRPSKVGLEVVQANQLYLDYGKEYDRYSITPAAIQLNWAERIKFENNVIRGTDSVAIGIYQGVKNCVINGNVIEDTADSAITVGLPEHSQDSPPGEHAVLSSGKPCKASGSTKGFEPGEAVDDNNGTGWSGEGATPMWWQVDLGESYKIDKIEIVPRQLDQPTTRSNFEILGSNDPDFAEFAILAAQGSTPFSMEKTAEYYVRDRGKYRYVRIKKTDAGYLWLSEVKVINESMPYVPTKETCYANKITNNYITRAGIENWSAPAIQAYYVNTLNISHNEIYDVNYSGVCVGWGWANNPGSKVCRNNSINYNRIHRFGLRMYDAGGIYTLGQQPNSVERGNYISDQYNHLAALYSDNGTKHYTITDNVVENTFAPGFINSGSGDIIHKNNYSPDYGQPSAEGCESEAIIKYVPGTPPMEALQIMKNAGLEPEYAKIKEKANPEIMELNDVHFWSNAVGETETQSNMSMSGLKIRWINNFLDAADTYTAMAVTGTELGTYPESAVERMKTFVAKAKEELKKPDLSAKDVVKLLSEYKKEYEIFKNSVNTAPKAELIQKANEMLNSTNVGVKVGDTSEENYKLLKNAVETAGEDELSKAILMRSILDFEDKKVNLNIDAFDVNGSISSAVIDNENAAISITASYRTNRKALKPQIKFSPLVNISPSPEAAQDFTKPVVYTLSTKDGSAKKDYTVTVNIPEKFDSETPYRMTAETQDEHGWATFGAIEHRFYKNKLFGDAMIDIDANISGIDGQWAGIAFRSQNPEKTFDSKDNECYIIVFTSTAVELHRFNGGVRTQFYGDVGDVEKLYGESIKTNAFDFSKKNNIRISTKDRDGGVEITLTVNDKEIFNVFDNYEGAITYPGYFGTVSPKPTISLSAE